MQWNVEVRGGVDETWSVFSDTDRFNRAIGTKLTFEERPNPDGTVRRTGSMVSAGLTMRWREVALDFVAPRWFRTIRVFEGGPIDRYHVDLEVEPSGPTTKVQYRLTTWPRSFLTRPVVATQLHLSARRGINRTIDELVAAIEGRPNRYDPTPPPLSADAERRLTLGLADVPSAVAGPLADHLRNGSVPEQDHIQPVRLARRWGLPVDGVVEGLLAAVAGGVLALTFDLLCPSCFGAKARLPAIDGKPTGVHCASCNIAYDARFPDAVGVSFRPAPSIRALDVAAWCIASPQRMPHVVARLRAAPEETVVWTADLTEGAYRLRAQTSLSSVFVHVHPGASASSATADLSLDTAAPLQLEVQPGPVSFAVRSRIPSPEWLLLERRWRPPDTLTLGALLAHEPARRLLGANAIGPDLRAALTRSAVFVAETFRPGKSMPALLAAVEAHHPSRVRASANRIVALWPDVQGPLSTAKALEGALQLTGAVGYGPVMDIDCEDLEAGWLPAGRAVDEATEALRRSLPGRTSVGTESADAAGLGGDAPPALIDGPKIDGVQAYLLEFDEPAAPPPHLAQPLPARDDAALTDVTIAGRFVLGEALGKGAFGTVYDARDKRGGAVVVKVMRQKHMHLPTVFQQFFSEARALSMIDDPNVVAIRDFGHDTDGQVYVAMEKLEGESLQERLHEHTTLDAAETIEVAIGVLRGLEAAHGAALIHRDLKPANVFVGAGPILADRVTLLDFGLALPLARVEEVGAAEAGTFEYMSPEQLGHGALGPRSDLYSVGLLMYRCLSGKVPRGDLPSLPMVTMRIAKPAPELAELVEGLPEGVADEVMRALARDPAARRPTAGAMRAALEALRAAS